MWERKCLSPMTWRLPRLYLVSPLEQRPGNVRCHMCCICESTTLHNAWNEFFQCCLEFKPKNGCESVPLPCCRGKGNCEWVLLPRTQTLVLVFVAKTTRHSTYFQWLSTLGFDFNLRGPGFFGCLRLKSCREINFGFCLNCFKEDLI